MSKKIYNEQEKFWKDKNKVKKNQKTVVFADGEEIFSAKGLKVGLFED